MNPLQVPAGIYKLQNERDNNVFLSFVNMNLLIADKFLKM